MPYILLLLVFAAIRPASASTVDILYVMQESGSFSTSEYHQGKNFIETSIQSLDIGVGQVNAGISMFANQPRLIQGLTGDQSILLNALDNAVQMGGSACLSCALSDAYIILNTQGRSGAQKVVVFLSNGIPTAGELQSQTELELALLANAALNDYNILTYSILFGIGSYSIMNNIALGGGTGSFYELADFAQFNADLNANLSTVPLPAAFWLFGSALIGLVGYRRRRKLPGLAAG